MEDIASDATFPLETINKTEYSLLSLIFVPTPLTGV